MGRPIRVLLADDHAMFRQGLAGILPSYGGIEVVAEVPNGAEVPRLARELRPDAVVMEVRATVEVTRETLEAVRSLPDPPRVVICSAVESPRHVGKLVGAGASAYVPKTSPAEDLVAAIRAAVLGPERGDTMVGRPRAMRGGRGEGDADLPSARELEVLLLAARGLPNARIAEEMHLSASTVKRHLANVYEKMDVNSRSEAAREALLRDWFTAEEITAGWANEEDEAG